MDFKKKTQEKFDQSKNYIKENDIKGKSGNLLQKFIKGLKLGKRIPVLIATLILMTILWIPMMYGAMTISIFGGNDGMSNKELNSLQDRLDKRYESMLGE
ncbi:hypothetical protein SAP2_00420 [Staphylococcus arlettae]|uniref:hypothetical protein n=1 Tax=Staphylococcus TaxID=1279 RepID=UPI000A39BFE1|nr:MULTISPECIES: hypothetical protein [Staphylococcus]EGQ1611884.1 hypothetical protein [Staphylococcus pseudintermedius]HDA7054213.1 hypothetical protein [Staphylococcus aureus]MDR5649453.1 hypothetical protein [Staphylococcus nepalensis]PTL09856.1 hypothetical protein BUZ15_08670 [Staphylococcus gallinarum]QKQ01961.1 hypothetical protein HSZ47_00200 [Staphylococcus saprophyticus]